MYFRDANVAIVVFDVTSASSFQEVGYWVKESINVASADDFVVAVVGNKRDMVEKRQVSEEEARKQAKLMGAHVYHETSAKDPKDVQ